MARLTSLSSKLMSSLGRALAVAGVATAVLLHGPAQTAAAAGSVDYQVVPWYPSYTVNRGGSVDMQWVVGSNRGSGSAMVTLAVPRTFSNVKVIRADDFNCTVKADQFFNSPIWKISCYTSHVRSMPMQVIDVRATVPTQAGTWGATATLNAADADDSNDSNDTAMMKIVVR